MSVESYENLSPAWDAILEVYKPFSEICARHGLRMWVAYGTMLGAVRHAGFIPWDDDFDVMMPRSDYDKFISEFSCELPEHLKLVTRRNAPEFTLTFAKIQDSRKDKVQAVEKALGRSMSSGIYIDIFPLDGCDPRQSVLASRFWSLVFKARRAWVFRREFERTLKMRMQAFCGFFAGLILPGTSTTQSYMDRYERLARSVPFGGSEFCAYYEPSNSRCHYYRTADYAKTVKMKFDNLQVPVPAGYDNWLQMEFGDYMTPPPVSKRVSVHVRTNDVPWKFGPTKG